MKILSTHSSDVKSFKLSDIRNQIDSRDAILVRFGRNIKNNTLTMDQDSGSVSDGVIIWFQDRTRHNTQLHWFNFRIFAPYGSGYLRDSALTFNIVQDVSFNEIYRAIDDYLIIAKLEDDPLLYGLSDTIHQPGTYEFFSKYNPYRISEKIGYVLESF